MPLVGVPRCCGEPVSLFRWVQRQTASDRYADGEWLLRCRNCGRRGYIDSFAAHLASVVPRHEDYIPGLDDP